MASARIVVQKDKISLGPVPVKKLEAFLREYLSEDVLDVVKWSEQRRFLFFTESHIEFHPFFALEFYHIFKLMSKRHSYFGELADTLASGTWVGAVIKGQPPLPLNWAILEDKKISLLAHQKEFIEKYANYVPKYHLRGQVLAFEQGLGKTLTAIALMIAREKERVIIICPKSLIPVWVNELKEKAGIDPATITVDKVTPKTKWLITNFESAKKVPASYYQLENTGLIVDESHYIKDVAANRTQSILFMVKHGKIDDILLLSGTPIKGKIEEWLPYLLIIDPMIDEPLARRLLNAFFTNTKVVEHITSIRLGVYVSRELKSTRLQLPIKEITEVKVEVDNIERYIWPSIKAEIQELLPKVADELHSQYKKDWDRIYDILSSKGVGWLELYKFGRLISKIELRKEKEKEIDRIIDKWLTLLDKKEDKDALKNIRKAVINFVAHVRGKVINGILVQRRIEAVMSIIDKNMEFICSTINHSKKKTVIVGTVIKPLNHVSAKIRTDCQKSTGIVTGQQAPNERQVVIDDFKSKDDPAVLVGSIGTMGVGFTLTNASTMIILNPPWRNTDIQQVIDRIHRIGQTSQVNIYICRLVTKELNVHDHMFQIAQETGKLVEGFLKHIGIIPKKSDY